MPDFCDHGPDSTCDNCYDYLAPERDADGLADALERASDRIENLLAALSLPLPDRIHLQGIRATLPEIRNEMRAALGQVPASAPASGKAP